jgi:hypothetical protein
MLDEGWHQLDIGFPRQTEGEPAVRRAEQAAGSPSRNRSVTGQTENHCALAEERCSFDSLAADKFKDESGCARESGRMTR